MSDGARRAKMTEILQEAARGEAGASEELLPIVYDELRRLARWRLARERPGQTLQPTALVHEAYLRLLGGPLGQQEASSWENRRHFFAAAAEAMRRILVERARRARRQRHGGHLQREGDEAIDAVATPSAEADLADLLSLDEALTKLEAIDAEAALVTKLRHYSGFTVDEVAEILGSSRRTVHRKWALARAWLLRELASSEGVGGAD